MTDSLGNALERYSYDAWGRQRSYSDWTAYTNKSGRLDRAYEYTGHETLPEFGLINMNGRVYDPILGRMLSPDNYVQSPLYSQNYNRYSYCLNNPLKFVDPDGNNPLLIAAIIVGAYLGGSSVNHTCNIANWNWSSGSTWAGGAIGSSVATSALAGGSSVVSSGISGGLMGGMTSGAISGAGITTLNGGSTLDLLGGGIRGATVGGFSGAISGGIGGAIGNFTGVSGSGLKMLCMSLDIQQ